MMIKNLIQKALFQNVRNFFSSSKVVLKNGIVTNSDISFHGDVHCENGKIVKVTGPDQVKPASDATVIDAQGKYIMPGGVETHTHLQLPFMGTYAVDDFLVGTQAALSGGTTTLIDFVIPGKGESLVDGFWKWRNWADPKVVCNYALHCAITDWQPNIKAEMEQIVKLGIQSFKYFVAYKGVFQLVDWETLQLMSEAKRLGCVVLCHCENGDIIEYNTKKILEAGITGPEGHPLSRNKEVEGEATHRQLVMANEVGVPIYVVHVMGQQAAHFVAEARKKGWVAYGETLAAGLAVDGANYFHKDWETAAGWVMSPCIDLDPRTKTVLMQHLTAGNLQTVGTDNCTFTREQKAMGKNDFSKIPNGVTGLEDRLSVAWNNGVLKGLLTPNDFVNVVSTNAAKIFNMYPHKGVIREGSDADLIIWDPGYERVVSAKTHRHAADFTIFEGLRLRGKATTTVCNGEVAFHNEEILAKPGSGKYVPRQNFGYSYERLKVIDKLRDFKNFKVDRDPKSIQQEELSLQQRLQKAENDLMIANEQVAQLKRKQK